MSKKDEIGGFPVRCFFMSRYRHFYKPATRGSYDAALARQVPRILKETQLTMIASVDIVRADNRKNILKRWKRVK